MKPADTKPIRIGTRASLMAVRQTEAILASLRQQHPGRVFEMVTRPADADLDLKSRLGAMGGKGGAFIKAMHQMLLKGEADLVMHSLKDLPGNDEYYADPRFAIGACLPRSDPRDALVVKSAATADAVPQVIGTASVRRAAFLRRLYPHAQVVPFRGAADKRISRMDGAVPMEFNYGGRTLPVDALVLAKAGLERIDLGQRISRVFSVAEMCPAVGQGVVVAEYLAENAEIGRLLADINDPLTTYCYQAERAVLRVLNGHCDSPIGAHAWLEGGSLHLRCTVVSPDGRSSVESFDKTGYATPETLGFRMGERLNKLGAQVLIEESRHLD